MLSICSGDTNQTLWPLCLRYIPASQWFSVQRIYIMLLEMFIGKSVKQPRLFLLNIIFTKFRGLTSFSCEVQYLRVSKDAVYCGLKCYAVNSHTIDYRLAWIQLDSRGPSPQQIFWKYCLQSFCIHLHYYYF